MNTSREAGMSRDDKSVSGITIAIVVLVIINVVLFVYLLRG